MGAGKDQGRQLAKCDVEPNQRYSTGEGHRYEAYVRRDTRWSCEDRERGLLATSFRLCMWFDNTTQHSRLWREQGGRTDLSIDLRVVSDGLGGGWQSHHLSEHAQRCIMLCLALAGPFSQRQNIAMLAAACTVL